jgi:uncharacterized surface protein with fasciclin (FAS1) repeats
MKNLFKSMAVLALVFSVTACNDDDNTTPAQQTITGIAAGTPDFSILVTALTRADLATTLDGSGQFTVFAPTNTAFNNFFADLGPNVTVDNVDLPTLRNVLLNHVIGAEVKSDAISTGYASTLSPISDAANAPMISMFIRKDGNNVFVNGGTATTGVRVTTADVYASNGVIHIVNAVIGIPTVVDAVVANPEFDTLQAVVTSTTGTFGDQSAVLQALSGLTAMAPATIFAPNNAAFTAATTGSGFAVGATGAQVTKVLQYHVTTAGNVQSSQLSNNQVVPMFTDPVQNTTVILTGTNVDIQDTANNLARVFQADIQCSNGVIHGVSRVLQPAL